jgi:hypothetical protein
MILWGDNETRFGHAGVPDEKDESLSLGVRDSFFGLRRRDDASIPENPLVYMLRKIKLLGRDALNFFNRSGHEVIDRELRMDVAAQALPVVEKNETLTFPANGKGASARLVEVDLDHITPGAVQDHLAD